MPHNAPKQAIKESWDKLDHEIGKKSYVQSNVFDSIMTAGDRVE